MNASIPGGTALPHSHFRPAASPAWNRALTAARKRRTSSPRPNGSCAERSWRRSKDVKMEAGVNPPLTRTTEISYQVTQCYQGSARAAGRRKEIDRRAPTSVARGRTRPGTVADAYGRLRPGVQWGRRPRRTAAGRTRPGRRGRGKAARRRGQPTRPARPVRRFDRGARRDRRAGHAQEGMDQVSHPWGWVGYGGRYGYNIHICREPELDVAGRFVVEEPLSRLAFTWAWTTTRWAETDRQIPYAMRRDLATGEVTALTRTERGLHAVDSWTVPARPTTVEIRLRRHGKETTAVGIDHRDVPVELAGTVPTVLGMGAARTLQPSHRRALLRIALGPVGSGADHGPVSRSRTPGGGIVSIGAARFSRATRLVCLTVLLTECATVTILLTTGQSRLAQAHQSVP